MGKLCNQPLVNVCSGYINSLRTLCQRFIFFHTKLYLSLIVSKHEGIDYFEIEFWLGIQDFQKLNNKSNQQSTTKCDQLSLE